MNAARRKAIAKVQEKIQSLFTGLDDARTELEMIREEEQECADNMPESMQYGERYENAIGAIDELDGAISEIEEMNVDEINEHLDSAISGC